MLPSNEMTWAVTTKYKSGEEAAVAGSIHELGRRSVLAGAVAVASGLARPAISQGSIRTLRVRPVNDLASLDPVWGSSQSSLEAAYMAYDAPYGLDASLTPQPQMVDGHDLSDDGLTWRFTLRDGLAFHDGETVRAQDAITSIARWAQRDTVGVVLKAHLDEMRALDDRRFEIRLKEPFPACCSAWLVIPFSSCLSAWQVIPTRSRW